MKKILLYLFLLAPVISFADGNNNLGQTYTSSMCGLDYAVQSVRLGQRFLPSGLAQPAAINITGIPQCAIISKAFLWVEGSGNGAAQTATINGPLGASTFPMTLIGSGPDKCWTYQGSYTYRADVTSAIVGNGTYYISGVLVNPTNVPTGNDMDGATLLIIYNDPTANWAGNIAINDGALVGLINNIPTNNSSFTQYTMTYPPVCGTATNGKAFMAVGDLQNNNATITLNGLPGTPYVYNWWNYFSVNPTYTTGQASTLFSVIGNGDCYNIALTGMYYRNTTCQNCPTAIGQTITLSTTTTPTQCNSCNGTATTNVVVGTPPYTYSWAPTGGNAATATGLCAGTYTVTVTSGCATAYDTVIVQNNGNSFNVNETQTNAQCYNICNGTATITSVNGGVPPYTYTWSPNVSTGTSATNLCPGTYTCVVNDANNCPYSQVFNITAPPAISATDTSSSPKCYGGGGYARVNPLGGTPPYTYAWAPSGGTSPIALGLAGGTYTCTVTDANNCTYKDSFNIVEPAVFTAITHKQNVVCQSKNEGYAVAIASGGTPPFIYTWAPIPSGDTIISNLPVGQYSVTITDSNNCTFQHTFNIIDTSLPFTYLIDDSAIDCRSAWLDAFPATGSSEATEFTWIFDTTVVTGHPVVHAFPGPGFNTAKLVVVNAVGCHDTLSHDLTIDYPMVADFSFTPVVPIPNTVTNFHNKSTSYASIFSWDFGDHSFSTEKDPVKAYSDSGSYHICLIASDTNNCADTVCKDLVADVDKGVDVPTAFSPNGDGINDVLYIRGSKLAIKKIHLIIFNRFGNTVFETDNRDKGWDGTYKGKLQEEDSYAFILEASFTDGTDSRKMGSITLLK